jgi:hypothetical protein
MAANRYSQREETIAIWRDRLGGFTKLIIILAVIALPVAGLTYCFKAFYQAADEANPHPTDPIKTATQFFTSLQNEAQQGYPDAYKLLTARTKAPVIIGLNSTEGMASHFDRVRNYLIKTVGDDFLSSMRVDPEAHGGITWFDNDKIAIRLEIHPTKSPGDDPRYGIKQVADFPHLVAPGLESRNIALGEFMSEMEQPVFRIDVPEDLQSVTTPPPLHEITRGYQEETMLDNKHALVEFMIYHYPQSQDFRNWLEHQMIPNELSPQLKRIAQKFLDTAPDIN